MPVMNYRKGTEKEKSWIIEETSFNENIQENVNLFSHREMVFRTPQFSRRTICEYRKGYVYYRNIQ